MKPLPPLPSPLPQGATALTDWGLIRASGPEARAFLHGQLTQDMQQLPQGQSRLAGYCSAKGRLLASFVVWPDGPEDLLLACSADLLPATLKRLQMFVLRARCKLAEVTAAHALWGLAGDSATAALGEAAGLLPGQVGPGPEGLTLLRLADAVLDGRAVPRWLALGVAGPADAAPPLALPQLLPEAWRAYEVLAGVPRIVAATAEQFVPQMVNLELVGGVDFRKGCYPGQEVVARSQYRGTLKRRAYALAALDPSIALQPGQELFDAADPGQPAGLVALAGHLGERGVALAELKIAAVDGGAGLHAGAADGPALQVLPLPYALPALQGD